MQREHIIPQQALRSGTKRRMRRLVAKIFPGMRRRFYANPAFAIEPGDVFLVSYPRSGNTWVRFMLAHLLKTPEMVVNFETLGQLVPDLHKDSGTLDQVASPRIIKSHLPYRPDYARVVYIVRDGRDAYLSYYHYRRDRLAPGTTLAQFIQSDLWPCSWGEHVMSWLDSGLDAAHLLVVRYEDLHRNAADQLVRIASFAGLETSKASIQEAVQASSFDKMQRTERRLGHPGAPYYSGNFVRLGKTGTWQEIFGREEIRALRKVDRAALLRLDYDASADM
jgi:hypothetical protein